MLNRIHCYRQLETSDCGITCLRIISRYYGLSISANYLSRISDTSKQGISVRDIISTAEKIRLRSKAVRITLDQIQYAPLPLILFWNQNHFVVLYRINEKKRKYYIADPGVGKLIVDESDFINFGLDRGGRGLTILMEPAEGFEGQHTDKHDKTSYKLKKLLYSSITANKKTFIGLCVLTIIGMLADISIPFIFKATIDDGINGKNLNLVWLLILGQFAVFLGNYLSTCISNILLTKLGLRVSFKLMRDYLHKVVSLPMSYFDRKVNSDLIQKMEEQNRIKNLLISLPDSSFFTIINFVVFSFILIYFNFYIYVLFLIASILGILWVVCLQKKRREVDYANFTYTSQNRNNLYELINGISEIKVHNAQNQKVQNWENLQEKINKNSIKTTFLELAQSSGTALVNRIKDITITGICAALVIDGTMTIGAMMTINYLVGRLTQPLTNLLGSLNILQDASMSYERIDTVMSAKSVDNSGLIDFSLTDIKISSVSFKYPGSFSPFVIKGLSCRIPNGKTTAIVGTSGSGKTTLLKLILGFYEPQIGDISVGAIHLSAISPDSWLNTFGVVMQNGYIFSNTIAQNIAIGDENPDTERLTYAVKMACLEDFIKTLPMGFNTMVGASGIELSGGQKQRLLIARVIYKNPQIIILDEATSSLDAVNERKIVQNIRQFSNNKTTIIVAHRLSTVKNADLILYMENGQINEHGTHRELVARRGGYYNLVKNQLEIDNC